MKISVVYALPEKQYLYDVTLNDGARVKDAIIVSSVLDAFPDLFIENVGIYGKKVSLDTPLSNNDRVEIYRPLPTDPKDARRRRGK